MSFKTTYILFGVFTGLLVIFALAVYFNPAEQGSTLYVLPSMHSATNPLNDSDIDYVEIQRNRPEQEKIVFQKDSGTKRWEMVEPRHLRATSSMVDSLVRAISGAQRETRADPMTDLAKAGLSPPVEIVTLKAGDREVKLNVGDTSPGDVRKLVYVTSSDDPSRIVPVLKSDLEYVFKKINDFRERDLLSPSAGDITALALSEGKKPALGLKQISSEGNVWEYTQPDYGRASYDSGTTPPPFGAPQPPPKTTESLRDLLGDVSALRIEKAEDFVEDDAKDLGKYHLDPTKDDVLKVEIDRTDEISTDEKGKKEKKTSHHVLLIGVSKKVEEKGDKKADDKGDKKAEDKSDQYYAYLQEEHPTVVKVSAKSVDKVRKALEGPAAYRNKDLVDTSGTKAPDAINIQNTFDKTIELRKLPTGEWKVYQGDTAYTVDTVTLDLLKSLLTQKNCVERFIDDKAEKEQFAKLKPDATVSVWLDGLAAEKDDKDKDKDKKDKAEAPKEKKESKPQLKDPNKPSVVLVFRTIKDRSAIVERKYADEKGPTVVAVSDKIMEEVRKGPVAYLDRKVPSFPGFGDFTDVTKVLLVRNGVATEVTRDKSDAPWKFVQPSGYVSRKVDPSAVRSVLQAFSDLRAQTVATEKADPDKEKLKEKYGITDANRIVVTATKDGKPAPFEYDFGKDVGTNVYLKASQSEMVYEVANTALHNLEKDLRDKGLWDLDSAKAREVRLRGQNIADLVFKKGDKEGGWTVERGPGADFKLDTDKLRRFLDDLARLRAEDFLKGPATPEQGLDVTKGAFKVEVFVEGDAKPFDLVIGAEDPKNKQAYFATSNRLSGDIFLVPKSTFEGPSTKLRYFSQ
jgi:hypothetical protein